MAYHKKTGILGGTFNPIHCGHLHLARRALEEAGLDEILFIPSGVSYMKDQSEILPAGRRAEMVRLAIQDEPNFAVSTIEIEKMGNSYSHETIWELQKQRPDTEFFFLTGADTLFSMEEWVAPAAIFEAVTVLAAYRSGVSLEGLKRQIDHLHKRYRASIRLVETAPVDISSSGIRRLIRVGKSIRGLVPPAVEEYIGKNHLYQ